MNFNTKQKGYKIELLYQELGTVPMDEDIYSNYILTKAKDVTPEQMEEELETLQHLEERGFTGFMKDEQGIFIYNYMFKGFFKSACQVLMENKSVKKISAYKTWIDKLVFIEPRRIHFMDEAGNFLQKADGTFSRALRVMTPQGPRVTLAKSEYVSEGRTLYFEIEVFDNSKGLDLNIIETLLEYGRYVGLGQWRSADYGRFKVV